MDTTKGHLTNQPGLRGHSHDPENDLMKQYVLARKVPNGWLWEQSFDTIAGANDYFIRHAATHTEYRLIDQFKNIDTPIEW